METGPKTRERVFCLGVTVTQTVRREGDGLTHRVSGS
jgi:hypothetical protein